MKAPNYSIRLINTLGLDKNDPKIKKMAEDFEWYVDNENEDLRNVVEEFFRRVLTRHDLFVESDSISSGGGCSHIFFRTVAGRVLSMHNTCSSIELSGSKGWKSLDDFINDENSEDCTRGFGWEFENPDTILSDDFDTAMPTRKVRLLLDLFFLKVWDKVLSDEPLPVPVKEKVSLDELFATINTLYSIWDDGYLKEDENGQLSFKDGVTVHDLDVDQEEESVQINEMIQTYNGWIKKLND